MTVEKKWDFKFPTEGPTTSQRIKFAITRANNNLKYGFDGSRTPLQLGPLKEAARPLLKVESDLVKIMNNGGALDTIINAIKSGPAVVKEIARAKKLAELNESK